MGMALKTEYLRMVWCWFGYESYHFIYCEVQLELDKELRELLETL